MEQEKPNFLVDPKTGEKFDIVNASAINNTDQPILAVFEVKPGQMIKKHRKKPSGLNGKEEFAMLYINEVGMWLEKEDKRLPINIGEIRHIKFGVGVGHELREHHYGIILARKGLMYLTAPLTSKPQDYGKHNYHFDNLELPSKNGAPITKSYVSFCHIRYVHQRRIEDIRMANKIKKFNVDEHVINILENFFDIIKGS